MQESSETQSQVEAPAKRSRILLSCAPCRTSKQKCDRGEPCSNCLKKGRADGCLYAPKPERTKPSKGVAARLKRLEGMVKVMIQGEGSVVGASRAQSDVQPAETGHFVQSGHGTTYIGATHFMAMLDDIEDLKAYFEESDDEDQNPRDDSPEEDASEMLLFSGPGPRKKDDILRLVPHKSMAQRLVTRYLTSFSPSQHTVHHPTFMKQLDQFWDDPAGVEVNWLALMFMVMALGAFFSAWDAPYDPEDEPRTPYMTLFHKYRTAGRWALALGKFSTPSPSTLQPLLLYTESEVLISRAMQTKCWLLVGICIRVMLKMGLHRDPGKMPNISPFEGEMRRRMWLMAVQVDLLVSFQMGMPSMIYGIESDCNLPRNLLDSDFDESSASLPPGRPETEYTPLSYPILKTIVSRVFGQVARLTHSLTVPSYADVMRLDTLLDDKLRQVPAFMRVKPLEECTSDPPTLVIQRFGLAALYQKSRCVLHRRYLAEPAPQVREHEYSRRACLQAALALLDYQDIIYDATRPGGMLAVHGWFAGGMAMHDFLLAAMVVFVVLQNDKYSEVGGEYNWVAQETPLPDKTRLLDVLKRSAEIWGAQATMASEVKKAADILQVMLKKLSKSRETTGGGSRYQALGLDAPMSSLGLSVPQNQPSRTAEPQVPFSNQDLMPAGSAGPSMHSWIPMSGQVVDWGTIDNELQTNHGSVPQVDTGDWMDTAPLDDFEFMTSAWDQDHFQGQ